VRVVRVLAERPGRRTAALVAVRPGLLAVRKQVRAQEFATVARTATATAPLGEPDVDVAPRLLGVDPANGVVLHTFVPGVALDRSPASELGPVLHDLGRVLARLHALPLPAGALPDWDAGHVVRKLDRARAAAEGPAPEAAVLVAEALPALGSRLRAARAPRVPVHGDVSSRNALVDPVTGRVRLVDWDRAATGPPAVDLAPLVGLLGGGAAPLLDGYAAAGGCVDAGTLADLVLANRLTRALRRAARGKDGRAEALRGVAAALEGR
jgi:aminoglycoside phosphotransferase (APT) family kinase protein